MITLVTLVTLECTGLVLDASTGEITGTPTEIVSGAYTVTASNTGGDSSVVLIINIVDQVPDISFSSLTLSEDDNSTLVWYVYLGVALDKEYLINSGGDISSVDITPQPSDQGLSIYDDDLSGVYIDGTPSVIGDTSYTLVAYNTGGNDTITFTISVGYQPPAGLE